MSTYLFQSGDMAAAGFKTVALALFSAWAGLPCRYLEIGVHEGGSGCWMLDNILTHEDARYTGVDDWAIRPDAEGRARRNLSRHGGKVVLHHDDSMGLLPRLAGYGFQFDLAYIDGCHNLEYCKSDLVCAWTMLQPGGTILLDDVMRDDYGVAQAIHQFLGTLKPTTYRVIYWDYMAAILKRPA